MTILHITIEHLKSYFEANEGALKDFDKAIELNPNDADYFNNRGVVKQDLEDIIGAINDYTKAIELNPNDGLAYNNREFCKQILKDFDSSCTDAKKAKELCYDAQELIEAVCN